MSDTVLHYPLGGSYGPFAASVGGRERQKRAKIALTRYWDRRKVIYESV
ncbi:MAG: hypothetical protein LC776_13995 [Acidobacteria bacterium]|nr:hypothetical protein [Acidobacteriota bacterium]